MGWGWVSKKILEITPWLHIKKSYNDWLERWQIKQVGKLCAKGKTGAVVEELFKNGDKDEIRSALNKLDPKHKHKKQIITICKLAIKFLENCPEYGGYGRQATAGIKLFKAQISSLDLNKNDHKEIDLLCIKCNKLNDNSFYGINSSTQYMDFQTINQFLSAIAEELNKIKELTPITQNEPEKISESV